MSQERKFFNLQNKNEMVRSATPKISLSPEVTRVTHQSSLGFRKAGPPGVLTCIPQRKLPVESSSSASYTDFPDRLTEQGSHD